MNTAQSIFQSDGPSSIDRSKFPQTAKFLDWYKEEQAKGLIDIKFFAGNVEGTTLESFFSEVNEALAAESVVDNELF